MYVYVYIRHRALRVSCDHVSNSAFQISLSNLLLIAYTSPPLIRTPARSRIRPPRGPPSKIIVFGTRPCKYSLFRSLDPSDNSCTSQLLFYS